MYFFYVALQVISFDVMFLIRKVLKLVVFVGVLVLAIQYIQYWLANKQYVFTKEDVAKLAKQYAGEFRWKWMNNKEKCCSVILKYMQLRPAD